MQAVGPAAVARFVLHRVSTLGPSASELASAVAVLGDGSELQLVADVTGLSEAQAREAADDLVRADIFADAARLGFVHPIVRAALYEDLAPGERQSRHAAAADALAPAGRLSRARDRTPVADRRQRRCPPGADAEVRGLGRGQAGCTRSGRGAAESGA